MTCGNCARHVGEALRGLPEVDRASVDLEQNRASVVWKSQAEIPKAVAALKEAGYGAEVAGDAGGARKSIFSGWMLNVVLGLAATLPMMVCEWFLGLGMSRGYQLAAFLLATPVQFICGWRFYKGAWLQAKMGGSNMDTLVALGSTTAYAFSVWQFFRGAHGHVYFMDSAAIITLISVGHWLEGKVAARAEETLRSLLKLAPETALRIAGLKEEEVPVAKLRVNDRIAIRPGDQLPTDGEVVGGRSAVDESMLTGESLPVEKIVGAKVFAGSANVDGRLVVRVTEIGEATALARIVEVVQRAQTSRAKIQKLADRISNVFVPIVIVIALATAAWWWFAPDKAMAVAQWLGGFLWRPHLETDRLAGAVFHTAAVLIIACPCAMGLATPIAIMAGANAAARQGILIRDGEALEKSGHITTVLFDKTGTLTEGRLEISAFEPFVEMENAKIIAASLAAQSRHPLSVAVAKAAPERVALKEWQEHRGSGIAATFGGEAVRLGSTNWLQSLQIETSPALAFTNRWTAQGSSVLLLASGTRLVAAIALTDRLKANAAEVLERLRRDGKKVALVTGDQIATARSVATGLGIDDASVFAEVRPEEKAGIVQKLQARGERVAFVGDGINDAPALAAADLGIAMGTGADAARQAADIVLLRAGLEGVPAALALARATLRTIKQNLFWAFFYNAAGIPLAALGLFSPILSAAAMGFSDLIVIGNALRLRRQGSSPARK
jgi:Cu+-exporting ATPase